MWRNPDSAYSSFQDGTGPANKDGSETMHTHLELGLARMGAAEMRGEIKRNRLEARLAQARRAKEASSEALSAEIGPLRRGMAARALAVVTALFR